MCPIVSGDEYVADNRSATVFTETERVLSSSSMNESILYETNRIQRYTSQFGESIQKDPLYKDLIKFRYVLPKSVPCELPKNIGARYKIELKSVSKYCVIKQWLLPLEKVLAIDKSLLIALQRAMWGK